MSETIPIACYLTDKKLQARRKDFLDKAAAKMIASSELENGFEYRFPLSDSILQDLAEIVDLERKCCPFLSFRLVLESEKDFVSLSLTGAEGTKEIIKNLFGWS